MSLIDYNQTLEDLRTVLKKNLVANGFNFDVKIVSRTEKTQDEINDDEGFVIIPSTDTLIESYASRDELRDWEVLIVAYISRHDVEIQVEKYKQDLVRNLNKEYAFPPEPVNSVEVSTVTQSALLDEFHEASLVLTAKFEYILEREV